MCLSKYLISFPVVSREEEESKVWFSLQGKTPNAGFWTVPLTIFLHNWGFSQNVHQAQSRMWERTVLSSRSVKVNQHTRELINARNMCWFCMSSLGLVLFQIHKTEIKTVSVIFLIRSLQHHISFCRAENKDWNTNTTTKEEKRQNCFCVHIYTDKRHRERRRNQLVWIMSLIGLVFSEGDLCCMGKW